MAKAKQAPAKSLRASGSLPALSTSGGQAFNGSRSLPIYSRATGLSFSTPAKQRERLAISRTLQNQVPFIGGIFRTLAHEAIGDGMSPRSGSSDADFKREATAYFERWGLSKAIDLARGHDFWTAQALLAKTMMGDGVCYALKVRSNDARDLARPLTDGSFRALQLQFILRDQLGNGTSSEYIANGSEQEWNQGVKFDGFGRPISYRVLTGKSYDTSAFVTRNASDMLRIMEPGEFNQRHGDPWIFTAGQSGFDLMDLSALRLVAAKIQATFLGALQTKDGSLPEAMKSLVRKGTTASADGATVTDNGLRYIELPGGVNLPVFAEGQTLSFFQGRENMPFGDIVRDLWAEICWACGVPPEYLANVSGLSSAATRITISKVKRFLNRIRYAIRDCYCQPVWEFVIGDAIERGLLPLVDDWRSVQWLGGGLDPSIDAGRDEKAEQAKLSTFTGTRSSYCAQHGLDGGEVGRARIQEILDDVAFGQSRAKEMGLELPAAAFLPIDRLQALAGHQKPAESPQNAPQEPTHEEETIAND